MTGVRGGERHLGIDWMGNPLMGTMEEIWYRVVLEP